VTKSQFNLVMLVCALLVVYKFAYSNGVYEGSLEGGSRTKTQQAELPATQIEVELLSDLNAPAESMRLVKAWELEEGSNPDCFNPLNTTLDMGSGTIINSDSVKCYTDYATGLSATMQTLAQAEYAPIVAAIQQNDDEAFISALGSSRWGTNADNVSKILGKSQPVVNTVTATDDRRQALVDYAMSLQGIEYISGGGSQAFRNGEDQSGGDCSSTMQNIYMHVLGINIGQSTFDQRPAWKQISAEELKPGDLWYGQYPDDQHTGMVVGDIDGDGRLDLIDEGGKKHSMGVNSDFLNDPYFMDHLIDFRRVLDD
jgi:cell wall-associated NlpC family hydrolase